MTTTVSFLLDEHYPPRLRDLLTEGGLDAVTLTHDRSWLRGRPDDEVLKQAAAERRVVVTEDVGTFMAAVLLVPEHCGVVLCHHRRFPRTASGLMRLADALLDLAADPPPGLASAPLIWWLQAP
ncbi:MAG: DUF5615 family PIN-like protein [Bifidobacteriaceae bacterium]|jgi:hypothetical protein|nr:DUF5615 family PIN-like protein [Bifidobacteriaceae bacterium]